MFVTAADVIDTTAEVVNWYEARKQFQVLVAENEDIRKFIAFFKNGGFSVIPTDLVTSDINDISILGLESEKLPYGKINYKEIQFIATDAKQPVELVSFPFNFTNPILFSEFKSEGHTNYTLKDSAANVLGYLSDIKYMENMDGGLCNSQNHLPGSSNSLGLLMSNFRKFNGDGDLIFILSWRAIWELIHEKYPNNSLIDSRLTLSKLSGTAAQTCVLPVLLSSHYKQTWGTCVVFNNEYLITNNHVLKPFLSNKKTQCHIYLHHEIIELDSDDVVTTPFAEIDLSFIRLSLANQFKLHSCPYTVPAKFTTDYDRGDEVATVGYGLFFNRNILQPIECHGKIAAKASVAHGFQNIPSIIITSASCWNGSSGGALVKDDSVVGLVCSNAQVKLPAINNNKLESEKLSRFCFVLPIEIITKCFQVVHSNNTKFGVAQKFINMWALQSEHKDHIVRAAQPKL